ncbi:MAG: hypothetical protein ACSHX9_13090 [Luteolibacter sp.]
MKIIISLVLGIMIGAGSMFVWRNHLSDSKRHLDVDNKTVLAEEPKQSLVIEATPTVVSGDLDNVPWQKYIYRIAWAVHNGDIFGEERIEAQNEVNEYYQICEESGSDPFPFIRMEKIERLNHLFIGFKYFKEYAKSNEDSDEEYHHMIIYFIGDDEDKFFGYACREYYQFLVDDQDDGIVGWDETRQKLASELFQINHPVSDRGFYRFLSESFDSAVSKETYIKFQNLSWPIKPEKQ